MAGFTMNLSAKGEYAWYPCGPSWGPHEQFDAL